MTETAERAARSMLAMQRYSWEQGVCAQALYEAGRKELWIPMAYDAVKRQAADGRLGLAGSDAAVSDPASNGEVCLRAYEETGQSLYLVSARKMLEYLEIRAPRTKDGIICHNLISFDDHYSAFQLWIDGLYMVPPFLAAAGNIPEAVKQIRGYIRWLFDEESGLFFHIVDTADGRFVRKKRWATGNGWALMGLARVIESAKALRQESLITDLPAFLRRLLKSMLRYQLPDGRFHDILDEPESFTDGTSAMMMAAVVFRGVLHGYIDPSCSEAAEAAYQTVSEKVDQFGLVREVCGCPDFTAEGTSAEAQAAFIMADAWRGKLYGRGADKHDIVCLSKNIRETVSDTEEKYGGNQENGT